MKKVYSTGVDSASSTPTFWQKTKQFLFTTLNAMTFGIFGTIVVGAIIGTIGTVAVLFGLPSEANVFGHVAKILTALTGAGIGLSIALSLKQTGLKLVMLTVAGGISTMLRVNFNLPGWFDPNWVNLTTNNLFIPNNPITAYFVVILVYFAIESIFRKKTVYDLFFIPLLGVLASILAIYIVSWPVDELMKIIGATITFFIDQEPYITSAVVALIFGALLTLPFISSAGIAVAVFSVSYGLWPDQTVVAMAAAVVGCSAQMIGFSVQTIRKNDLGTIFTVGLASSMFQFKNVMKKPMTWVPSLIASFVLAPISYLIFGGYDWLIEAFDAMAIKNFVFPGMGSSGLVGQLQTLSVTGFSTNGWLFAGAQIVFPAVLVYALDVLFIKLNWYTSNDLILDTTL